MSDNERIESFQGDQRFKAIFDNASYGIALVDLNFKFQDVNNYLCRMWGYSKKELLKKKFTDITHPDEVNRDSRAVKRLIRGEIPVYKIEKRYIKKDQSVIWGTIAVSVIKDTHKRPQYLLAMIEDVSRQREAEVALRESEQKYRILVEKSHDGVAIISLKGEMKFANQYLADLLGYKVEEMIGQNVLKFTHPDFHQMVINIIKKFKAGKTSFRFEAADLTRDGRRVDIEDTVSRIDFDGEPCGLVIVRDITERQIAENEVKKVYSQLQATIDSTNDGILTIGSDGKVLNCNRRFTELWRIPEKLIKTKNDQKLLAFVLKQLADPEAFLKKVKELYGSSAVSTDRIVFKDGRVFERFSMPLLDNQVNVGRVWSFRNITEQVRYNQIMAQSNHDLEAMNQAMVGREKKMIELKMEIKRLNAQIKKLTAS
jgi:PAS domain S-box-containing protein